MTKKINLTREEFEKNIINKLEKAVKKAKQNRELLRKLEESITEKQEKVRNYDQKFINLQEQLVKFLAIIYSKGT